MTKYEAAIAEVLAAQKMVDGIWSADQTNNINPESPLAKVRSAIDAAKAAGLVGA